MANVFKERIEVKNAADMDKIIAVKEESNGPLMYNIVQKKDGTEAAATGGLTVASVNVGGYTATLHNDATLPGLKTLKIFVEKGEIPEKHISPTRTGKGLVLKLALKDGSYHNTHIYLRKASSGRTVSKNVSIDDIDL